uniref:Probable alpha-galactosidase D n=1 Tax=Aspergillus terreus (strain NIH 2624 / FGSC A1156) TaxID=341663 RepID=AGALD_ASPTN|nr:RecName: Full=Probable alpha-galactosidase D; AltName: Full=Melibiase D; Flags: Precursor [Aspergillus terreus NIH2624]
MASVIALSLLLPAAFAADHSPLRARLQDGLARTPQMGWNTYNHYNCYPDEEIFRSNAKALVDFGLADLGYRYATIDCGWTLTERLANGSLTWNATRFPSGFPAIADYLHDLGLLFGVYGDAGIKLCGPSDEHEEQDAQTFAAWGADSLKYDNCFSEASLGYPNVEYAPSSPLKPRYEVMSNALQKLDRPILFQICEWGIDFPALWAPALGHSWRIGNDIIPAWRSVFRTLNQAVPQTDFAGPGQWPDLDMLMVGNGVYSVPEEETHFSLWAILKSPLIIGSALKDATTEINSESLRILKQKAVIGYNQDKLGVSASLRRRWTDQGYEVWSGPLSNGRTVAAVINWRGEARDLTLDLPDIGLQSAGLVKNIWAGSTSRNVQTSYTARVEGHGTMLLELRDTVPAGVYPKKIFGSSRGQGTVFKSVYAGSTSENYTLAINFAKTIPSASKITVQVGANRQKLSIAVPPSRQQVTATIPLVAGSNNTITISHSHPITAIQVTSPNGTYYPATQFSLTGAARHETCGEGFCQPVGSKVSYLSPNSTARGVIPASAGTKYVEIDYINNEVAFSSSWGWGANSRNLTISLNGGEPVRLEVPLSGRHSELFGPGKGWWDTATLGVSVDGWKEGDNEVVVGNVNGEKGFQPYAADFVGLRVFD